MLTIDANVFVSVSAPAETFHAISVEFLSRVQNAQIPVICPTLVLPETASGIIRPTGNVPAAQLAVTGITNFPNILLLELTQDQASRAVNITATCRLRGADAVYVAVAQKHGTTLITWDAEVLARGTAAASVLSPTDWLAANPI